ncbi:LacI family DNA-binding transcriptional regulator [Carnobacterium sp. TMP28]|uniref:LacI family DNA-binding transcriptional regulator n=1 Tax=Carnobacterium sp. TMP28 TaxID=3397060 RepID=UPI0039E0C808
MAGIKDIAKKAGVSISTVSYALNNSPKVTEQTRARIVAIANELNYIPNMAGRNLRGQKTNVIGVYVATYGGTFYGDLLEGIMSTLKENKYEMIVCSGERSRLFLPERMIDGAIILDTSYPDEEILKYAERGHKIVVMDREMEHKNIRKVMLDNRGGAKIAIQKLLEEEKRLVYLIEGPADSYDSRERLAAAIEELDKQHASYRIIKGDFSERSGRLVAKQIHQEWQESVAIFSLNDDMAIGIYNYFKETALRINQEIKIIGFDNHLISPYLVPGLTTIAYSKHKWGSLGAQTLLNLLEENKTSDVILKTRLMNRESC